MKPRQPNPSPDTLDTQAQGDAEGSADVPAGHPGRQGMRFSYASGSRPLDGYTIKRGIGIGGFGEVYFALNDAGKEVALKKIQRNLDIELRGVRHCLNLKHVNLISLWDIRSNEFGESWVVMEYVPGPSLRDVVEAHPRGMPLDVTKRWFASVASGVAYLHEHGIVHRDLKPGNIFDDQDEQVIKIGDYGLSKFISCSRRSGQTESVGTFHYMAPEIGKGEYGKEIDVYAMGIILYEMLTGLVPFDGESTQEIIMKHLTMDPDVEVVPEDFRRVISKSLRKDPQRRYRSVHEMLADLPWSDLADPGQKIVNRHAVGPLPADTTPEPGFDSTVEPAPEKADEEVVTPSIVNKLPPFVIGNPTPPADEISFGPLRDTSHPGVAPNAASPTAPRPQRKKNEVHFIGDANANTERPATPAPPTKTATLENEETADANVPVGPAEEPIAGALRSSWSQFSLWWNHANFSMPLRMGVLVIAGIVVVQNSQWLLPVILGLGTIYLIYFAGHQYLTRRPLAPSSPSPRQLRLERAQQVRSWWLSRPSSDRMTELVGSLLVGALGAIALSLLGLAVAGGFQGSSVEVWAVFTWQTLVSVAAVWTVLIVTNTWAQRRGEAWWRLLVLTLAGLLIGSIAFFSAGTFDIDLARITALDFENRQTGDFVFNQVPRFPAFLLFFAALFSLSGFGIHTDPVRRTRLSVMNVILCLVLAAALSHLLNVPLTVSCVLAVVISVSIQLASPWLHPDQQSEICRVSE